MNEEDEIDLEQRETVTFVRSMDLVKTNRIAEIHPGVDQRTRLFAA